MKNNRPEDIPKEPASQSPREVRLHALLFTGATLGSCLRTPGATDGPKIPPFVGE